MSKAFRYAFKKGSVYGLVSWLAAATFCKSNAYALVIEDAEPTRALDFIKAILPASKFHRRIKKKRYSKNVNVFVETHPRSVRQKAFVKEMMTYSNVAFINPPWYFVEDTRIPKVVVSFDISDRVMEDLPNVIAMVRKSYSIYSYMPVFASVFLREGDLHYPISMQDFFQRFVAFWSARGVIQRCQQRELLGNVLMLAEGVRVDPKTDMLTVGSLKHFADRDTSFANVVPLIFLSYDNGYILFQWLVQCAMGLCTKVPLVVADPGDATLSVLKTFCDRCRIAVYDETSISEFYDTLDHSAYHLHVFRDANVSWEDVLMVRQYSNCIVIKSEVAPNTLPSSFLHVRFRGIGLPADLASVRENFETFLLDCYDLTVREPAFVLYARDLIRRRVVRWGQTYETDAILGGYAAWCEEQGFVPESYAALDLSNRQSFCNRMSMFFKCEWDDQTICFRECRRLYGKQM
jgi:hypothetical protein